MPEKSLNSYLTPWITWVPIFSTSSKLSIKIPTYPHEKFVMLFHACEKCNFILNPLDHRGTNIPHKLKIKYPRIYNVASKFWHINGLALIKNLMRSSRKPSPTQGCTASGRRRIRSSRRRNLILCFRYLCFRSKIILAIYPEYVKKNACGFYAKFSSYFSDLFDKIHRSFKM